MSDDFDSNSFGWAVIGPGRIAQRFADAVDRLRGMHLVGVHGRTLSRAQEFASTWRATAGAFDDMDALIAEPRVHGVYIASTHAAHSAAIEHCLRAGKPVLCEKPLVVNARQAETVIGLARRQQVFLMEALWTRFLPLYAEVGRWLSEGAIGPIRGMQASFGFNVPFDPRSRVFDPAQAGGALLDIGVYPISMFQWALGCSLGARPGLESLEATGVLASNGVDLRTAATLRFSGGVIAQFQCLFDGRADNAFRIYGESGVITIPREFWQATGATMERLDGTVTTLDRPFRINGFEGQIEEAVSCIGRGAIESATMPHGDTLEAARWMDAIRHRIGVRYAFD